MPSLIHDIIKDLASFAIKYESSIFCVNIKRPHKTSFIECIFFSFLLWHFGCTVSELYEKKCFIEDPETNPDVLRGGHRNPYQLEKAIKSGGTVFCLYHLSLIVYQGAVVGKWFYKVNYLTKE